MDSRQLTSELMWRVALVMALIDTPLLILAARCVSPDLFRKLKWYLSGTALFVFAAIWGALGSVLFWDTVYQAIFPQWSRWLLAPGFGLLDGVLALVFWRVSLRAARLQVVWFILLGGLASLVGHSLGVGRGLFRVPLLAETSVTSALTFGVFEYIFYWWLIVSLSVVGRWFGLRL